MITCYYGQNDPIWHLVLVGRTLKVPGPISQNGNLYSNDASSPKKSWYQMSVKLIEPFLMQEEISYFATAYTLMCKLNYGYRN